jgi:hypothetical protein
MPGFSLWNPNLDFVQSLLKNGLCSRQNLPLL